MQYAIIHTETGVIRKLTVDPELNLGKDESMVEVADTVDLANGFLKISYSGTLLPPTQEEIDASGVDETRNAVIKTQKQEEIFMLRDAIIEDKTVPASIRDYFSALKEL